MGTIRLGGLKVETAARGGGTTTHLLSVTLPVRRWSGRGNFEVRAPSYLCVISNVVFVFGFAGSQNTTPYINDYRSNFSRRNGHT